MNIRQFTALWGTKSGSMLIRQAVMGGTLSKELSNLLSKLADDLEGALIHHQTQINGDDNAKAN
jgi:hypothetical protein